MTIIRDLISVTKYMWLKSLLDSNRDVLLLTCICISDVEYACFPRAFRVYWAILCHSRHDFDFGLMTVFPSDRYPNTDWMLKMAQDRFFADSFVDPRFLRFLVSWATMAFGPSWWNSQRRSTWFKLKLYNSTAWRLFDQRYQKVAQQQNECWLYQKP